MSPPSGMICNAIKCGNNRRKNPTLSFFRIPKDVNRAKEWIINSRREDLICKDSLYLHNNIRFCADHFEQSQFMNENRNKLIWNAIPTLFNIKKKLPSQIIKQKSPTLKADESELPAKKNKTINKNETVCLLGLNNSPNINRSEPSVNKCLHNSSQSVEERRNSIKIIIGPANINNNEPSVTNPPQCVEERMDSIEIISGPANTNNSEPSVTNSPQCVKERVDSIEIISGPANTNNSEPSVTNSPQCVEERVDSIEIISGPANINNSEPSVTNSPQCVEDRVDSIEIISGPANISKSIATNVVQSEIIRLKMELMKLRKSCNNRARQIRRQKLKVNMLKNRLSTCTCSKIRQNASKKKLVIAHRNEVKPILSNYLSKEMLDVVLSQINKQSEIKYGSRWNNETKTFAINFFNHSPRGYRFLKKYLNLPSVRTVHRYLKQPSSNVLEEVINMTELEEVMNFSIDDDLVLIENVSYNSDHDYIGFENYGRKQN